MATSKETARRAYATTRLGQMHLQIWPGPADSKLPLIVCLHPIPYSGRYYDSFATELAVKTSVIAPDLAGYGGSDALTAPASLEQHTLAIADALQDQGVGQYVPLGFHTGSAIAAELALQRPKRVPRAVCVTYPFLEQEERAKQLHGLGRGFINGEDIECLRKRWRFTVHNRAAGVPLESAITNFVEELRTGENAWFGFDAMFRYAPEERLPEVQQPVLVININSSLKEPTQAAAKLMPNAHCVDFMDMSKGVFELHATKLIGVVEQFLQADLTAKDE